MNTMEQAKKNRKLKDIVRTQGFSKAFDKMANHTVNTSHEAKILTERFDKNLAFSVFYGNDYSVDASFPLYHFAEDGSSIGKSMWRDSYSVTENFKPILDIHTHPVMNFNPIYDENTFKFSHADIENFASNDEGISGIVLPYNTQKGIKAISLLWRPYEVLEDFVVDRVFEKCLNSANPIWETLSEYGQAAVVNFEFRDGLWQPRENQLGRLEVFDSKP